VSEIARARGARFADDETRRLAGRAVARRGARRELGADARRDATVARAALAARVDDAVVIGVTIPIP
tara:strand:+ start:1529 stop:1729 length:201 start_codon:yes stop_codon:yes gene_type:complete